MNQLSPKISKKEKINIDEKDKCFVVSEIGISDHSLNVLFITYDFEEAQTFLLKYIDDLKKDEHMIQYTLDGSRTVHNYRRGYIYGKTLVKKYIINDYEIQ